MTQPCCRRFPRASVVLVGLVVMAAGSVVDSREGNEEAGLAFFSEKVYPILEENCFECHGGGERLRGDFRVTSRAGLLEGGHLGPAFNADSPEESLLLAMISYRNEEHQMPPRGKLPEEQLAVLSEWIERGAPYDPGREIHGESSARRGFSVTAEDREWWAYRPSGDLPPPSVSEAEWSGNGIDAFIKAQLDREGLKANPVAAPEVLVRRLYYDLIGLPPSPEEVDRFVADSADGEENSARAYRELVDDLLSRPQYGEKWARHWLDVVRYAESNGFERDNSKPHLWRYRDYVIDSFNSDKPYDRFVIEQLAGDEIADPSMESMIATGYHRLMQWDDEPADRKQHVFDVLADNVQVTAETFLATTLGCARCHDHKVDPLSQKDFHAFMAFFGGVTHYRTEGTIVSWATPEEKSDFERGRREALDRLGSKRKSLEGELRAYFEKNGLFGKSKEGATLVDDARGGGALWFYTTATPTADWYDVGFSNKAWYRARGGFGAGTPPGAKIRTEWNKGEIWKRTTFRLQAIPDNLVLEIYHDEDAKVYLNGVLVYEASGYRTDYEVVVLPPTARDALQTGQNVVAVYCRNTGGGQFIDLSLRTSASEGSIEQVLSGRSGEKLAAGVKEELGRDLVGEYQKVLGEIAGWQGREPGVPLNVVTERVKPDPMHIHLRGSAHALGEEVGPGLPAVLASEDSEPRWVTSDAVNRDGRISSGRRLALAHWITDPGNALSARVLVNRVWQHHFGRGIVPSTSDFGRLGEAPTHPELLDWLAKQFVEGGWSVKSLHRLILHSRTYRMSSEPESANLAADPQNLHFWRHPMRRLTAEELRDSILAVSGNLNLAMHGEWVYPPLPDEVLATASRPGKGWPVSEREEDHFRRSLYVHVKRSLRHQMLADFDQADTDTSCAVRFTTTVPTQALTMLNSKFVNDQATVFALRMRNSGEGILGQIATGIGLALQREPNAGELDYLMDFHETLRREAGLSPEAAMERIALLLLNLNEFLYLD